MTDIQYGMFIGAVIASIWFISSILAAGFYHYIRAKEEQAFEDNHNYRPHREGNIVAFRRR